MTEVPLGADPRLDGPVTLVAYSPQWPSQFEGEAKRIRSALGERALVIEHVGSTSVPGLIAKPVIDICLVVADSADEPAYVPSLERAGYVLRIREPEWFEHRLLNGPDIAVNLHVFGAGSPETGCCAFGTGSGPTRPIASCTRWRNGNWRCEPGSTCRTTQMPRVRWWRRSPLGR